MFWSPSGSRDWDDISKPLVWTMENSSHHALLRDGSVTGTPFHQKAEAMKFDDHIPTNHIDVRWPDVTAASENVWKFKFQKCFQDGENPSPSCAKAGLSPQAVGTLCEAPIKGLWSLGTVVRLGSTWNLENLMWILQCTYHGQTCIVRECDMDSCEFNICCGVRQWYVLCSLWAHPFLLIGVWQLWQHVFFCIPLILWPLFWGRARQWAGRVAFAWDAHQAGVLDRDKG